MEETPRHQCLIYDGSPAKMLPALAAHIKQKLDENIRCLYLNGLLAHPALFINQTLAFVNPSFLPSEARIQPVEATAELQHTVYNLCAMQLGEDKEQI
jgi:hypothetical protein